MFEANETTNNFLLGIKAIEPDLESLGFASYDLNHIGYATYVEFQRENTIVRFMYGPSDWAVDIVIVTPERKFEFKDLMQIPAIADWVANNRYRSSNRRDVTAELRWFIKLLKFSLPIVV